MAMERCDCWRCEVCGYRWMARGDAPTFCAKPSCRSRKWNDGKAAARKTAMEQRTTPERHVEYDPEIWPRNMLREPKGGAPGSIPD